MNRIRVRSFNTNRLASIIGVDWINVEFVLMDDKVKIFAPDDPTTSSATVIAIITKQEAVEIINAEIKGLNSFKSELERIV